jgi:hypothetical protein
MDVEREGRSAAGLNHNRNVERQEIETMHNSRRTIGLALTLVLAVSLAPAALAADNATVTGTWKVAMEMQGQPVDVTLEIKEAEGGALTGTWTSPRGSDPLADVEWDGQQLSFSRTVDRQGQQFKIEHTAKVTGDTLEGKMILPQREIPFSGKKAG